MKRLTLFTLIAALAVGLAGCPRQIIRDASTYTAEIVASVQRQHEAMNALFIAAETARLDRDLEKCKLYAHPALVIEAKAQAQGDRALWLAGMPYVNPDGSIPEKGEEQPDPGVSPALRDIEEVCKLPPLKVDHIEPAGVIERPPGDHDYMDGGGDNG